MGTEADSREPGRPGPTAAARAATGSAAADNRNLATALRVGALVLTAGASTDDVERWMTRVARAAGLRDVQAAVTLGILTVSAVRPSDGEPISQVRIVGRRTTDYHRLAALSAVVDRIEDGRLPPADAPAELDRIDAMRAPYGRAVRTLATALSSAASTLLFGGDALDAVVTLLIGLVVDPVVTRVEGSGIPDFFQAVVGPLIATLLAVIAVAAGLPIHGGLVITGGILRFLPGSAFVAGMRDLIDRSIISGSARLAEAVLLGVAVGAGTAGAIRLGTAFGGPALAIGQVGASVESQAVQVVAAGFACAFFAMCIGVRGRVLGGVFGLGGLAWAITLSGASIASDDIVPVLAAAIVVGVFGQVLALRAHVPSVLWTVPAVLPLLPGLTIVRGILGVRSVEGLLALVTAVGIGFALGAGVAFGSIVVTLARDARANRPWARA